MPEKLVKELRVFYNNGKDRDMYVKSELSIGDKFITVKTDDVTVIYPTCNVTKIIIGGSKK